MRGRAAAVAIAVLVAVAAGAASPVPAQADWLDVLRNCAADGSMGKAFSPADLERALKRMPADLAEYSECDEQIADALRSLRRAFRLSAADQRRRAADNADGRDGEGRPGPADRADGQGAGRGGGRDSPPGDPDAKRGAETGESGDPDQGVGGALLSGAEAVGSAPLDVVEAAAEGRLGLPGFVWAGLGVVALLGAGIAREYRSSSAD